MFIILPYNSFPVDLPDEAIQRDFIAKLVAKIADANKNSYMKISLSSHTRIVINSHPH